MNSKVRMSKNTDIFELASRVVDQPSASCVICILTVIGCSVAQGPPTVINDECSVVHVRSGILELYKDDSQWLQHSTNDQDYFLYQTSTTRFQNTKVKKKTHTKNTHTKKISDSVVKFFAYFARMEHQFWTVLYVV